VGPAAANRAEINGQGSADQVEARSASAPAPAARIAAMSSSHPAPRTALVTGASSGIGREFAVRLAHRGYGVVLVARRAEELDRLAGDLRARFAVRTEVLPADLTKDDDVHKVAERLGGSPGGLPGVDVLVNNAGVGASGPFAKQVPADFERLQDLNMRSLVRLTHAALPGQIALRREYERPVGVINISSMAGLLPGMPGGATYAASKAFVRSFSESVALEVARHGVRVTAVLPGYVPTEMTLGMQGRNLPRVIWVSPERVVAEGLRAFALGRTRVVPGLQYKVADALLGVVPQGLLGRITAQAMRRLG
jgi:uncharacterized protein